MQDPRETGPAHTGDRDLTALREHGERLAMFARLRPQVQRSGSPQVVGDLGLLLHRDPLGGPGERADPGCEERRVRGVDPHSHRLDPGGRVHGLLGVALADCDSDRGAGRQHGSERGKRETDDGPLAQRSRYEVQEACGCHGEITRRGIGGNRAQSIELSTAPGRTSHRRWRDQPVIHFRRA